MHALRRALTSRSAAQAVVTYSCAFLAAVADPPRHAQGCGALVPLFRRSGAKRRLCGGTMVVWRPSTFANKRKPLRGNR